MFRRTYELMCKGRSVAKCLCDLGRFPTARRDVAGDADSIGFGDVDFIRIKELVDVRPSDVSLFFGGWNLGHAPFRWDRL